MAKLLMIGNGFDLYHKLPTRYTDFLAFVQNWDTFKSNYDTYKSTKDDSDREKIDASESIKVRLDENGKLTSETMIDFASYVSHFKDSNIEYLDEQLKDNKWIKYFIKINYNEEGWIDFEKEIENVLLIIEDYYCNIHKIIGKVPRAVLKEKTILIFDILGKKAYKTFYNFNGSVLSKMRYDSINFDSHKRDFLELLKNELDILIECLYIYLSDFVSIIKCDIYSQQVKDLGNVFLLSFNYTNTYKTIYEKYMMENHAVHGDFMGGELVLGVSDDAFDNLGENKLDYIYFQKYFQRIQKRTGSFYKKWLELSDDKLINEVYIMGHSLDKTDKTIIEEIFNAKYVEKIYIFFHNQWAYENLVIKLIEIFGRDFIIEKVAKEEIIFKKLELAKTF